MRAFFLFLILFLASSLFAEPWINTAGHSIDAKLIGRKGDVLTLKKPNGTRFTLHRSALSAASQLRADQLFPAPRQPTHDDVVQQRQKERLRQLELLRGCGQC